MGIGFNRDSGQGLPTGLLSPVRSHPRAHAGPAPVNLSEPRRASRILLAEDNPTNQQVALILLRRLGCVATVATDGCEVLERLRGEPFDLILMDVQMPRMDGIETTRRIRQGEAGERHRKVRIIALTANALHGDREVCLEAGMCEYLTKPITLRSVAQVLETWGLGGPGAGDGVPAAAPCG